MTSPAMYTTQPAQIGRAAALGGERAGRTRTLPCPEAGQRRHPDQRAEPDRIDQNVTGIARRRPPIRDIRLEPTAWMTAAGGQEQQRLERGMVLARYVDEYSVTGLTSNPTNMAINTAPPTTPTIAARKASGASDEEVFFELALADLRRAAELFAPVHARTDTVDGWVSLEVSPLLAHDTPRTVDQAEGLHRRAALDNLFIKIPGTPEGLPAIEECICAAVPVNVTLLFSAEQYQAAAEAYLRGVERRIQAGRNPAVASVASLFVSRWDTAVAGRVPGELRDRLGIAVARQAYRAYRALLDSPRWLRLANEGARAQRLLWASTSVKDPEAPDVLYVEALTAPFTVDTMPDHTLEAFADHGTVGDLLPADGGDANQVIAAFARAGIDAASLAGELQRQGARRSWPRGRTCWPGSEPGTSSSPGEHGAHAGHRARRGPAGRQGGRIRGGPDPVRGRGARRVHVRGQRRPDPLAHAVPSSQNTTCPGARSRSTRSTSGSRPTGTPSAT